MNKGKLVLLVGIPGSGKTTIGREMGTVYSSDDVRQDLFGSAEIQDDEIKARQYLKNKGVSLDHLKPSLLKQRLHQASTDLVFDELHQRIKTALASGETVVYDATNISRKKRRQTLKEFEGLYDKATAVFVDTPLKTALERNQKRARKVPGKVIRRMARNLEAPTREEGYDEVTVIHN